jgi:hypothetical protein
LFKSGTSRVPVEVFQEKRGILSTGRMSGKRGYYAEKK